MRGRPWTWMALLLWLGASGPLLAQQEPVDYARKRGFYVPFSLRPEDIGRIREVQLYVSENQGRAWRLYRSVGPSETRFPFSADRDGEYWFIIRTLDTADQYYPATIDGQPPGLRVIIDTTPPTVLLQPLPSSQDQIGVQWDIRDENLDPASMTLEYRSAVGDWQPVAIDPQPVGRKYWTPIGRAPFDVRLRAQDRARNSNTGSATIGMGGVPAGSALPDRRDPYPPGGYPPPGGHSPPGGYASAGGPPAVLYVNSVELNLNYRVEEEGPSGIEKVELYYTRDGRTWQRYGENSTKMPPFRVKLPSEGVYGLTLVVKSGVGLGDPPPRMGDQPQMWVEVDLKSPDVRLLGAEASRGGDLATLTVTWTATDKNLDVQPITISYAELADGPWTPIAQNLENSGRYVWTVPAGSPHRFFLRVEARDKARNVGVADTKQPIIVDLKQPRGVLLGIDPVPSSGGTSPPGYSPISPPD